MKNSILWILLLIVAAGILWGCTQIPGKPTEPWVEGEAATITELSFYYADCTANGWFTYAVRQEDDSVILRVEDFYTGEDGWETQISEPLLEELGKTVGHYRLEQWDGFQASNSMILDGSSFSIFIRMADGSTVSARGTNAFPENYGAASKEILAHFREVIAQYKTSDREEP